jgi:hypothetical protein
LPRWEVSDKTPTMKLRILTVVLSFTLALGMTACHDITTPDGTLRTAADLIQKNDFEGFQGLLSGQALQTYGNADGMNLLRTHLANKTLNADSANAVGTEGDPSDYTTTYTDTVTETNGSRTTEILDATIECRTQSPGMSPNPSQGNENGLTGTVCTITEIKLVDFILAE